MTSRLALATTVVAIVLGHAAGVSAQTYEVTKLVPGAAFHGVHGLGIDKSGRLFAGSVAGAALYEVDRNNGTAKIAVPSPEGMSDDIAFAPDGKLIVAEVGAKRIVSIDPASGAVTEIAGNLPIGLPAAPGGLPNNIPTGIGVGTPGVIYFSSDIENAIYKVTKK